jgi:hypothetical protein
VLLVFGAPSQLLSLAGLEHGRTIPLGDIGPAKSRQSSKAWAAVVRGIALDCYSAGNAAAKASTMLRR